MSVTLGNPGKKLLSECRIEREPMFKEFVPGRCGIALNKQKRAHDFLAGGLVPGARCLMGRKWREKL